MMRTITAVGTVTADGKLVVPVPEDIPQGSHEVIVILEERIPSHEAAENQAGSEEFLVYDLGPWPERLSLRREDLYDDRIITGTDGTSCYQWKAGT